MKDALKSISQELALEVIAKFQSPEVQELLAKTKAAADSDTGTFEVVITTENLDRYQEVIKLDGWELDHYRKNPVVLWGHDHSRLIGMATDISVADGKMVAKGKFAPTEEGQEKRRLYDLGFLRATSVGFIEKEREGNLVTKAELLEFSFVSVPANPFALSLAMEKSLSVNELVTKGIMFVEKGVEDEEEAEEVTEAEEAGEEPAERHETSVEQASCEAEERNFSMKQVSPIIDSLKAVVVALEALGEATEELEGDSAPTATEDDETRRYQEFSRQRRIVQQVTTTLCEVLADARRIVEARK